jgi:DNA-directed RNA polymerase alpha subunit
VHCCKVEEWNEIRLPGKFIRVKDAADTTNDMVLSNYYYDLTIPSDCEVTFGIHQENPNTVGAELRQQIEMNFIILKKEADGDINFFDYVEFA